jgi:sugar (pentulose or hexulose) kinase
LAPLLPALVAATGLPASCQVLCGIHDSNASLLRYLEYKGGEGEAAPRTVLSTGTWAIAAALGRPLSGLDERADMLANVNALGDPVACMRFMGGRESGGPFVGSAGAIAGPAPHGAAQRYALATLYCALMTDYCMERLDAAGDIVIEGSFTGNPHFAPLLAALRAPQPVGLSDDASGSSHGAALLWRWNEASAEGGAWPRAVAPLALAGLAGYRERWRAALSPLSS